MCEFLGLAEVAKIIQKLDVYTEDVESGKDWEVVVHIALAMRCLEAKHTGQPHAMLGLPELVHLSGVIFKDIPGEHKKPIAALKWWKSVRIDQFPYVAVLSPTYSKFETFDKILVYQKGARGAYTVRGFQMKEGREYPTINAPAGMSGVLMQGKAAETPTGKARKGWTYPSRSDVTGFLGKSLEMAYPASRLV